MDSILVDQLEWLVSGNMEGLRFKRQLLLLAGCLADNEIPAEVEANLNKLTQWIAREEVFNSLLEPLNLYLGQAKDKESCSLDISTLWAQVDSARQDLKACEPANIATILTWLLGQARSKKLLKKGR